MGDADNKERAEGSLKVPLNKVDETYLNLAAKLAKQRVRYSQEWQFAKAKGVTDQNATQIAIEATGDEMTITYAAMKVVEAHLHDNQSSTYSYYPKPVI